jgi:serine/threonine-protein phosphatase 2A regulatory subunit B
LSHPFRSCLTGSYHNYFRIYDVETTQDVVLQADKSAFKSKKLGGPGVGKGPKGNGMKKESMNIDTIDFNKKILHASWHPHENTIAVGPSLFLFPLRVLNRSFEYRSQLLIIFSW